MSESKASSSQGVDPGISVRDPMRLEEIVRRANEIGLQCVEAKKQAERLEYMKATIRAQAMERHEDGHLSEAKIRRLAETDPIYIAFLEELVAARAAYEKLRIRYESYKNLFEARRSLLSYQKAEMRLL